MSTKIDNQPLLEEPSPHRARDDAGKLESTVSTAEVALLPPPQGSRLSFRTLLVAALFLMVIAIGGYFFSNKTSTPQRQRPVLEVTPESLDFGKVDSTTDFPWKLRVTNVSSRTVQVSDIRASCGCTKVTPSNFDMEPGETRDVELRMNLLLTRKIGAKGLVSPIEVKISPIIFGARIQQAPWTLEGRVLTPCLLDTNKLVFAGADALVEGAPASSKRVLATLAYDDLKITPRPSHSGDAVEVSSLGDKRVAITIRPAADRPQGWFSSPIDLVLTGANDKARGVLQLDVQGEVVPSFTYYPRVLDLGPLALGAKSQLRLVVDTKHGKLLDASPLKGEIEMTIEETKSHHTTVIINCRATEVGLQESTMHLIFQAHDGGVSTAEVPIWYTGRAAGTSPIPRSEKER